jgi:DNA-binding response OmpR family regulator
MKPEKRKIVVVIDDDDLVCRVVEKVVCQINLKCVKLNSGRDFESQLKKEGKKWALVVVDLVLPHGPTGWDIIDMIRQNPDMSDLGILVLTGASISENEKSRIEENCCKVMKKQDFSIGKFKNVVEQSLSAGTGRK